jgi:hypothetical protein
MAPACQAFKLSSQQAAMLPPARFAPIATAALLAVLGGLVMH